MRVALDVESVLTDILSRVLTVYNAEYGTNHTVEDIDSWDWTAETLGLDPFMTILETEWTERPLSFQPLEEGLSDSVARLYESYDVDIVTTSPSDPEHIVAWLDHHGITSYDEYVAVDHGTSKATLGYDIYIDDKPALVQNLNDGQTQYLIKHEYNRHLWMHDQTHAVGRVRDAVNHLCER